MTKSVDALLSTYPDGVQEIANAARGVMTGAFPEIKENVDEPAKLIGYSYGPGLKAYVGSLILSKTGVKLGIAYGAALQDPKGIMKGEGKVHRHVQLSSVDDLKQPGLKQLLKDALAAYRKRTES